MKLVQIVLTSVIISGLAVFITTPSASNIVGAIKGIFSKQGVRKKRQKINQEDSLFVICKDAVDYPLSETLVPEINNLVGMQCISLDDSSFSGLCTLRYCRELIERSSIILIILTEDLMRDPLLKHMIALCFQRDVNSVRLSYEQNICLDRMPECFQHLIHLGCKNISFDLTDTSSKSIRCLARKFVNFLDDSDLGDSSMPLLNINLPCHHSQNLQYDVYFICTTTDTSKLTKNALIANFNKRHKSCFSSELIPGKYLFEGFASLIHSSRLICVLLTTELIEHPLFQYQLSLALRCKGHGSVILILGENIKNVSLRNRKNI